ncbi:MAG: hypothetical protein H6753_03145 [Candidatus Omnitrophica bacterium]|nr:hypothetical protein [Candidatus Omnitrophota bacterium]
MKKILFFLVCVILFLSSPVSATEQVKEILYYSDARMLYIEELPLESYFNAKNIRPDFSSIVGDVCTSGRRGYQGYWDIENGYLYLTNLFRPCSEDVSSKLLLSTIFPDLELPIKAIWFSGVLHAQYEEEVLELVFENGKLIKESVNDSLNSIRAVEPKMNSLLESL